MGKHREEATKRRVRWDRIFLLSTILVLLISAGVWGVVSLIRGMGMPDGAPALGPTPQVTVMAEPTQAPTAEPTPSPTPEPLGKVTIEIMATGDLMNHDDNLASAKTGDTYDFTEVFAEIAPTLRRADLTIGNLETTIGDAPHTGYPSFRSPPEYLDALLDAGFDVLGLANNHILDKGFSGVEATVAALEQKEIPYAGAYATREAADDLLMLDVQGVKVAIVAFAEYTNANSDVPYAVNYLTQENIAKDVPQAHEAGADIVVALVHWGIEYSTERTDNQRLWAVRLAEAGVDVIFGTHPHVVEPAGWIEVEQEDGTVHKTFVAYSLGNFISAQRTIPRDAGTIFGVTIEKDLDTGEVAVLEAHYVPTWVKLERGPERKVFTILPSGRYNGEDVPALASADQQRVRAAWRQVVDIIGEEAATPMED